MTTTGMFKKTLKSLIEKSEQLQFDSEKHRYTVNGTELSSATGLLGNDLSFIPKDILEKAQNYGTLVHSELEHYINNKYMGSFFNKPTQEYYSNEIEEFKKWEADKDIIGASEIKVFDEQKKISGTIDLVCLLNGKITIIDFKTSAQAHKKQWAKQLSVYAYVIEKVFHKIPDIKVMHFDKNNDGKLIGVYDLEYNKTVEDIIDAHANGEEYEENQLTIDDKTLQAITERERALADIESAKKSLEAQIKDYREKLKQAMVEQGVTKFENDYIRINYIEETTRKRIDSKKLKAEKPEIYNNYLKESKIKDSVRVKIKENNNE